MEPTETREISHAGLRDAIKRDPGVAMTLLGVLGKRLREAMRRVEDQSQHGATARVAASLLLLVTRGAKQPIVLDVPRPRYTFAADVGLTPESFSRALTRLEEAGVLVRLGGAKLQVLGLGELERTAAGNGVA